MFLISVLIELGILMLHFNAQVTQLDEQLELKIIKDMFIIYFTIFYTHGPEVLTS